MEKNNSTIPLFILAIVMIGGFFFLNNKITKNEPIRHSGEISRKDELILEGLMNDYFYRRHIKDAQFKDFDAYGNIVGKSIIIYVGN